MSGRIYFIQVGADGPIKVGYTKSDPLVRMYGLQCACPWELRLIGSLPGTKFNENWLHEKLSKFKMLREWFDPAIISDIGEILSANFTWPAIVNLSPMDRAILIAGSQSDLSIITGCHQPTISTCRRTGKLPRRIQEFLASHEHHA